MRHRGCILHLAPRQARCARGATSHSHDVSPARARGGRGTNELRAQCGAVLSPCRDVRRPHSQRGKIGRSAGRVAEQIRAGHQNLAESDPEGQARIAAFREGLGKLGWTEGREVQIDYRWFAGDADCARVYAAELVKLKPDAIFAATSSSLLPLQRETRSVPIVFAQVADPVG